MSIINTPSCIFPHITNPNSLRFSSSIITSKPLPLLLRCRSSSGQGDNLKDALSGMVNEQVEQLLNKEENRGLLDGLEQASLRVEKAKQDLAEIEKQQLEAKLLRDYVNQLQARQAEIAECQQEISEARKKLELAGTSLLLDSDGDNGEESKEIDKDKERFESVKAALISALVGSFASLPIFFNQATDSSEFILPVITTCISCALFGVTFRYAVRRDLDNIQLKTGTAAAFGFVKGLGTLSGGPQLELNSGSILSHAYDGALYVSQNFYVFFCAAVALDFCIKARILSPFPKKRSSL